MKKNVKGSVIGLSSGITWALYTIGLYWILNSYAGFPEGDSTKNLMLIVVGAIVIAVLDMSISVITEMITMYKLGTLKVFINSLFSTKGLGILPAAILAGPLGLVPYAIANSISPVAGALSMLYPVIGALASYLILKQKLSKLQWSGVLGTGVFSVLLAVSGSVNPAIGLVPVLLGILTAVGWGLEAIFGYKLMEDDTDPIVTVALRHAWSVVLLSVLAILIVIFGGLDYNYLHNIVVSISSNYSFLDTFIPAVFVLSSVIGSVSYMMWYTAMNILGVAKAMILNISYGVWIPIITLLCGMAEVSFRDLSLIILTFLSISLVIFTDKGGE